MRRQQRAGLARAPARRHSRVFTGPRAAELPVRSALRRATRPSRHVAPAARVRGAARAQVASRSPLGPPPLLCRQQQRGAAVSVAWRTSHRSNARTALRLHRPASGK